MLLEGAAVVRFANKFLSQFNKKHEFVLVAMFFRGDGKVSNYALFEPPGRTVGIPKSNHNKVCCTLNMNPLVG